MIHILIAAAAMFAPLTSDTGLYFGTMPETIQPPITYSVGYPTTTMDGALDVTDSTGHVYLKVSGRPSHATVEMLKGYLEGCEKVGE